MPGTWGLLEAVGVDQAGDRRLAGPGSRGEAEMCG